MGIDLEMFVRIKDKSQHLTPEQVLKAAVNMCRVIGPQNFSIGKIDNSIWEGFAKPIEEAVGSTLTDCERAYIRHDCHALVILPPWSEVMSLYHCDEPNEHKDWLGKPVWTQDGEPWVGTEDDQLIVVNWSMRYYGMGYERGDWPVIRETIKLLYATMPQGSEVWMGGDSSGVLAEHVTEDTLKVMDEHWYKQGGNYPYRSWFGRTMQVGLTCPVCKEPTNNYGVRMHNERRLSLMHCQSCWLEGRIDEERALSERTPEGRNQTVIMGHGYRSGLHDVDLDKTFMSLWDKGVRGYVSRDQLAAEHRALHEAKDEVEDTGAPR